MPEMAIAQNTVETLQRVAIENTAPRVLEATLEPGELACVQTETLRFTCEILEAWYDWHTARRKVAAEETS